MSCDPRAAGFGVTDVHSIITATRLQQLSAAASDDVIAPLQSSTFFVTDRHKTAKDKERQTNNHHTAPC